MFTLSQALDAIKDKPEFSVKDKGSYTVIDYNLNTRDTFVGKNTGETFILLNLRGTVFDNETGQIIRLMYDKFFNYGEFPESDAQLDFTHKHVITQKLDGSLIAPIYAREGIMFGTRAGVTDIATMAAEFSMADTRYADFISVCQDHFCTPMFEFCSRKNRVVLDYPEDMLVLTGVRYMYDGGYMDYDQMVILAADYDIPVVKRVDSILQKDFGSFREKVSGLIDDEGVVVRFEGGSKRWHMVKLKASQYVLQHKAIDQLKFAKDVLLLSLTGALDDVIPLLTPSKADQVNAYVSDFWRALRSTAINIMNEYSKFKDLESQKDFALAILDNKYKNFMFGIRAEKKLDDMLIMYAKSACSNQAKCSDLEKFIGMTVSYF